jgi:hypothetical protein
MVTRERRTWFPGYKASGVAVVFYVACLAAATYPMVRNLATAVPRDLADPLMHLWVMRWYKSSLLGGHLPFYCPHLQYPAGAPLGYFSPMHLQSLIYLPISLITNNDALSYNLLWVLGFLLNGMGTFFLGWYVLRHRAAAWFAGLVSMLSGTMTIHAIGHLELLYVGWFPLFLIAWIGFVDRPSRRSLLASVALFLLLTMGAAYFMAQAVIPAAFYLIWRIAQHGRSGWLAAVRSRLAWLTAFGVLTVPPLLLLFSSQIWAILNGHSMARPDTHFSTFVAPLWTYFTPTSFHALGKLLPFDVYEHAGHAWKMTESASYLGIVTLGLMHYAAVRRIPFERARFVWVLFAVMVILSLGASWTIGSARVTLPASWLRSALPIFRLTRNPSRFNMYATVCAAVIAAAGMRHLLNRIPSRLARLATLGAVSALAVADLSVDLYPGTRIPQIPPAYAWLNQRDPEPTLLEIPMQNSGSGSNTTSACGYWQSFHGGATSAGYSGVDNTQFDNLLYHNCPLTVPRLADPDLLVKPDKVTLGVLGVISFDDYLWLFTREHQYKYVVLHQSPGDFPGTPEVLARVKQRLESAKIYDDGRTAIYESGRLKRPSSPVLVCSEGWRQHRPWEAPKVWHGRAVAALERAGVMTIANPDGAREIVVSLDAAAFQQTRLVRLVADGHEVAEWTIRPGELATYQSPPFRLSEGIHEVTLVSDGESRVKHRRDEPAEADRRPYSLRVARVGVAAADAVAVGGQGDRSRR